MQLNKQGVYLALVKVCKTFMRRFDPDPRLQIPQEHIALEVPQQHTSTALPRNSPPYTKPRFIVGKLPIFGKIVAICDGLTPNQLASVAAYCTLPVVGTHRPFVPESSGPFKASVGNVPYICPPFTAPPSTM